MLNFQQLHGPLHFLRQAPGCGRRGQQVSKQVEQVLGMVDQDDLVFKEAVTQESVHLPSVLGGDGAEVFGERVEAIPSRRWRVP